MVACESRCIPFDGNKMADWDEPSLCFFQLLHLEKWDIAEAYLNIIPANFKPNLLQPFSRLS